MNILKLNCNLSNQSHGYLALHEAKTKQCKKHIMNEACYFEVMKTSDYSFNYKRLERKCPVQNQFKQFCIPVENINPVLSQITSNSTIKFDQYFIVNESLIHNEDVCNDYCLTYYGAKYSIYVKNHQLSNICYCIKNLDQDLIKNYMINESECYKNNLNNVLIQQTNFFGILS